MRFGRVMGAILGRPDEDLIRARAECEMKEREIAQLRAELISESVWLDNISRRQERIDELEGRLDAVEDFLRDVGANPEAVFRLGTGDVLWPTYSVGMLSLVIDERKVEKARRAMPQNSFYEALMVASTDFLARGEETPDARS